MRILLGLLALGALGAGAPCQSTRLTRGITPLQRPAAPGALRGLTVSLVRTGDDPVSTRAIVYLRCLLADAGARVAYEPPGAPEGTPPLAVTARAHLQVDTGFTADEGTARSLLLPATEDETTSELQAALADAVEKHLGECQRHAVDAAPVLTLVARFTGPDGLRAHRAPMHGVFQGIVDWWTAERRRIDEVHRSTYAPAPAARGAEPFHRRFWPLDRAPETEAEVASLLRAWRRGWAADATQVYLDVRVRRTGGGWELQGATELPAMGHAARALLAAAGLGPLAGDLRALPDSKAGAPSFGVVTARAAQTWLRPSRTSGDARVDDPEQGPAGAVLQGEPVWVLDAAAGFMLVHAASGRLGWVRDDRVRRCDAEEFERALAGLTKGVDAGTEVARRALDMLGTPYLAGGRSSEGIDGAGLALTSWAPEGVPLPGEARTQVAAGILVATASIRTPLRPGDLLFFVDARGRLAHTGVSVGGSRFVHAAAPEVSVGSLDAKDPWYSPVAARFCLAKRVAR